MSIVCIILARKGSKGIPNKNIIDFCGKPLVAWTILQAKASKYLKGNIFVSSDSDKILKIAQKLGVNCINRPDSLSNDHATAESALKHAIQEIEKSQPVDIVVYLQPTSPLRTIDDIDMTIKLFIDYSNLDSAFSASQAGDLCLWGNKRGKLVSINYDYKDRKRKQEVEYQYIENGSIYVFRRDVLFKYNNRLGKSNCASLMKNWQQYEIDNKDDLDICKLMFKKYLKDEQICLV